MTTAVPPTERPQLSVVRPRVRLVDPYAAVPLEAVRPDDAVGSFVELVRLVLPVSSLSAQRAAAVRQDLRLLVHEARRGATRAAVCEALMTSVVDQVADGVSSFSLRSLRARAQLPARPEPA